MSTEVDLAIAELERIGDACDELAADAGAAADVRVTLYDDAIAHAESEWQRAHAYGSRFEAAVEDGLAPDWMVVEYFLAQHRKQQMQRLYRDRVESRAVAQLPGLDHPPQRIAVGDSSDRIE